MMAVRDLRGVIERGERFVERATPMRDEAVNPVEEECIGVSLDGQASARQTLGRLTHYRKRTGEERTWIGRERITLGEILRQHFERDVATQARVGGTIDRTHAAATDERLDRIAPELCAGVHGVGHLTVDELRRKGNRAL